MTMQTTSDPPIIINAVSYRSREEIPEDIRDLWDDFERHRAREAAFWEREGIDARPPPVHVGGAPPPRDLEWEARLRIRRLKTAAVAVYLVCLMGLGLYGSMNRDPPLVFPVYDAWTLLSFALLFGPVVPYTASHFSRRKKIREGLCLLAVGLMFAHTGAFHAVPKLLHDLENQSGEAIVTVYGKYPSSKTLRCTHVAFKEFRFFSDAVCVSDGFYEAVDIGDRLLLTGRESRYGFAPEKLHYLGRM